MGSGPLARKKNPHEVLGDKNNVGTSAQRGNDPETSRRGVVAGRPRVVAGLALEVSPPSNDNPGLPTEDMAGKDPVVHTVIVMGASVSITESRCL